MGSRNPTKRRQVQTMNADRLFEARRWPNGPRCPRCGADDATRGTQTKRRRQVWYCLNDADCGAMFSVTSGTLLENTKLPLQTWLLAFFACAFDAPRASLARELSISRKAAWMLGRRIDEIKRGVVRWVEWERLTPAARVNCLIAVAVAPLAPAPPRA